MAVFSCCRQHVSVVVRRENEVPSESVANTVGLRMNRQNQFCGNFASRLLDKDHKPTTTTTGSGFVGSIKLNFSTAKQLTCSYGAKSVLVGGGRKKQLNLKKVMMMR